MFDFLYHVSNHKDEKCYWVDNHEFNLMNRKVYALIELRQFKEAEKSTKAAIDSLNLEEANIFCEEFLNSFYLTLDEQRNTDQQVGVLFYCELFEPMVIVPSIYLPERQICIVT